MGKGCWGARVDRELCDKVLAWQEDAAAPKCDTAPRKREPVYAFPGTKQLICASALGDRIHITTLRAARLARLAPVCQDLV